MTHSDSKIYIDVEQILKSKLPSIYGKLPNFVIHYLVRIFHQHEVNADLRALEGYSGVAKFRKYMEITGIQLDLRGVERVPTDEKIIFAANHPFGGPDGIMIMSAVSTMFPTAKMMVNDLLMHLPDVEDVFVPINRFGSNKRTYVNVLDETLQSNVPLIIFPAGLVSRKIKGQIVDLEWKKSFIHYAKRYGRTVVPVFISGKNSNFFYNLANWRKRFGIKANIEQLYLVDEFYKHKNERFTIHFGEPIRPEQFTAEKIDGEWAAYVKNEVYSLK